MTLTPLQTLIAFFVLIVAGSVLYALGFGEPGTLLIGTGIGLLPRSGVAAAPDPHAPLTAPPPA